MSFSRVLFKDQEFESFESLANAGNIAKLAELALIEPPNPEAMYWAEVCNQKLFEHSNNFSQLIEAFEYYKSASSWGHPAASKNIVLLYREHRDGLCNDSLAGFMRLHLIKP